MIHSPRRLVLAAGILALWVGLLPAVRPCAAEEWGSLSATAEGYGQGTGDEDWASDGTFDFDPSYSWVSVRAGALFLHRSRAQSHDLLTVQVTGESVLSTSEGPLDWATGPELSVMFHLSPEVDFEFNWFSISDWSGQHVVDVGGVVVEPIGAPLTSASISSRSSLHNFEFNLRRSACDRWTLLAGFRYLELDDAFAIHYEDTGSGFTQDASPRATNRLYGVQIGADGELWKSGRWALMGWAKAGIYGNASRARTDVDFNGVPIGQLYVRQSDVAFVGDLGLRGTRQLGQHSRIYAGYRVMFVDGVALAANQYDSIVEYFTSGAEGMVTNGSPFYHGAEVGFAVTY